MSGEAEEIDRRKWPVIRNCVSHGLIKILRYAAPGIQTLSGSRAESFPWGRQDQKSIHHPDGYDETVAGDEAMHRAIDALNDEMSCSSPMGLISRARSMWAVLVAGSRDHGEALGWGRKAAIARRGAPVSLRQEPQRNEQLKAAFERPSSFSRRC